MSPTILLLPIFDMDTNYCKINQYYFDALIRAGAQPLMIPLITDYNLLDDYLRRADGIMLPGGIDIAPQFYNEETAEYCGSIDLKQDEMSLYAIKHAHQNKLPLLGICRGFQSINVYFGGSLYQDNQHQNARCFDHHPKIARDSYAHEVTVVKPSQLFDIVGSEQIKVNSIHHQGIKTLGKGLIAEAHASDGLIEAIRYDDYIIGVQWHPEALSYKDPHHQAIFDYFVSLCRTK